MGLLTAFGAILRRDIIMLKRYLFNSISSLLTLYIIFCFIFFGMKAFASYSPSGNMGSSLEGTVVGFFVWSLALFAYSDLAWGLISEAQSGTLEQLYLSPFGFKWVSAFGQVSNFVLNSILAIVSLFAMMATTGKWLNVDLASLAPLILITIMGSYGIGYALGGLALVFKRIQAFFQIVQFIFIGFLLVPEGVPFAKFLPLWLGNRLIYRVMVDGERLLDLPAGDVLTALAVGAVYLALGLVAFSACERVAKDRGLLGHY